MTPIVGREPALGLGCAPLGNLYEPVGEDEAVATVDAAWDRGIRFFDTAPLYGHGLSETRLGAALRGRPRDEYVLSTKVGRVLEPVDSSGRVGDTIFADVPLRRPEFDFTAAGVERSLSESLERLGTDRIDVVHVHDPDDHLGPAVAAAYPALQELRDAGTVGAIGLGTNHPSTAQHVLDRVDADELDLDWLLLAGRYTLLDRTGTEVLDRCAELGVRVIAAGVFNSGLLAGDPATGGHFFYEPAPPDVIDRARRLADLCDRHEVPLAAAAVQFPRRHPAVAVVLPGARSSAEIEADVDLYERHIPDDLWDELHDARVLPRG